MFVNADVLGFSKWWESPTRRRSRARGWRRRRPWGTNHRAPSPPPAPGSGIMDTMDTAKLGKGFVWADGLSVTVSAPKTFKPSDTAGTRSR